MRTINEVKRGIKMFEFPESVPVDVWRMAPDVVAVTVECDEFQVSPDEKLAADELGRFANAVRFFGLSRY